MWENWGPGKDDKGVQGNFWGVIDRFSILIVVMISCVFTCKNLPNCIVRIREISCMSITT